MKRYNPGLKALQLELIEEQNAELREDFRALGPKRRGLRYARAQRDWAIGKAGEIGVRATARLLELERKTIQRWLRAARVRVRRAPAWVYDWARWRNERREKWKRIKARRGN